MPVDNPWQYFLDREKQKENERNQYGRVISPDRPDLSLLGGTQSGGSTIQPRPVSTFIPDNNPTQPDTYSTQAERPDLMTDRSQEDPYAGQVQEAYNRLDSLSNRYSPNYQPVVEQDHGWKGRMADVLKNALFEFGQEWRSSANSGLSPGQRLAGAAGGSIGGGLAGGFNPTLDEQRQRVRDIYESRANLGDLLNVQRAETYNDNIRSDNKHAQDVLNEKTSMDKARVDYWNRKADQGDLKLASNDELIALRDKWMTSKDVNDKRRLDIADKELTERSRHNQVTEKQASTNEVGRNNRARYTQSQIAQRQQITIAAQKEAAALRASQAAGRQSDAQRHQETLLKLRQQYEGIRPPEDKDQQQ